MKDRIEIGMNSYMMTPENFGGVNHMILGAPGTGKTRYLLEPMLLQMSNASHIIVDIKGSLYDRLNDRLVDSGYRTECYDFIDMEGLCYNPIEEVHSEEDALAVATAIAGRTSGVEDPFWNRSVINILAAVIGYGAEFRKHHGRYMKVEERLYNTGTIGRREYMRNFRMMDEIPEGEPLGLPFVIDMIAECSGINEPGQDPTTVEERFHMLMAYMDPEWWPGKRFRAFTAASDRTISSIIATFSSLTNAFRTEAMRRILSRSHFSVDSFAREKKAVFIQLKDYDTSLHQVAAIMITQAINGLLRIAGKGHLDIPVQVWMDDCGSYVVPGLSDKMSCCRSRGIGFTLLCQSEHQLRSGYGHDEAETIIQCCHSYFYLGGEDYESTHRISVRGDLPQSEILAMDREYMYLIQQGQRLRRIRKMDESEKMRVESLALGEGREER